MATTDGIKQGIISELQVIVGDDYVVYKPEDLIVYEYDGSADKAMPAIVVVPETAPSRSPRWSSLRAETKCQSWRGEQAPVSAVALSPKWAASYFR